jgi:hypothetical protein
LLRNGTLLAGMRHALGPPSIMWVRFLHRRWLVLVLAMIVHTALFLAMQRDVPVTDPMWYAGKAYQLAFHPSPLFAAHDNYPFVMRLGLTGPLALIYRVFGVSTFTTNLLALLAGLAILGLAYAAPATPRGRWCAAPRGTGPTAARSGLAMIAPRADEPR